MIHGPRRIGKTSLLHQLRQRLERSKDGTYYYVPVYIDLQGTPEERFFGSMMQDIVDGCEGLIPADMPLRIRTTPVEEYTSRDFSRDIKAVMQTLAKRSEKRLKLVMLMDEVDELNSYSEKVNQRLRSIFMKTFAEDLVAVMSGSHIRKHWESEGSPWFNFFEEIKVSGISRDKAVELIK